MDRSEYKTLKTAGEVTYSYYAKPASDPCKPTLLFCHGYPDSSRGWRFVAPHFEKQGYGVIVPDLLGSGATDCPTDAKMYSSKLMAASIMSIVDAEGLDKIVAVGHDHGANMAARLVLWHPERVEKLILVCVGYRPPAEFNLEETNAMMQKYLGYTTFGYWPVQIDEPELLMEKSANESWFALAYPKDATIWRDHLCPPDCARKWITERRTCELAPWVDDEDREEFRTKNFPAQTRWYAALTENIAWNAEKVIPENQYKLKLPVLMVNATRDYACNHKINEMSMPTVCEDLTMVLLESDHWVMRWVPEQLNEEMDKFLTKQ